MKYLIGIAIGIALVLWVPEFLPWVKSSVKETLCSPNIYISIKLVVKSSFFAYLQPNFCLRRSRDSNIILSPQSP